jgi:hypothetical protein
MAEVRIAAPRGELPAYGLAVATHGGEHPQIGRVSRSRCKAGIASAWAATRVVISLPPSPWRRAR